MDTLSTLAKRIERLERALKAERDPNKRETMARVLVELETRRRALEEKERGGSGHS